MNMDIDTSKERLDDLGRNGFCIWQNPSLFCFGMDAVLLSHFAEITDKAKVLDICSGNGIIPIMLRALDMGGSYTAIEYIKENVDLANKSIAYNHMEDVMTMIHGDITDENLVLPERLYDVVTVNPPYMIGKHGLVNDFDAKAIARHEITCTLEDVVKFAAKYLRVHGKLYMVHRPFRLPEIMNEMSKYHIEPKRMRLVYPYVDKEPNMVLIEAVKGGNPRLTVEKPLIVYKDVNVYTDEVKNMYQG